MLGKSMTDIYMKIQSHVVANATQTSQPTPYSPSEPSANNILQKQRPPLPQ